MKKIIPLLCALLCLLAGCAKEPLPTEPSVQSQVPTVQTEETNFTRGAEEEALLGVWSNLNGISAEFYIDEYDGYQFKITTEGYELSPNVGQYWVQDGELHLEGWFSQNQTEYYYENDTLTLEINGCSFTLTKQE